MKHTVLVNWKLNADYIVSAGQIYSYDSIESYGSYLIAQHGRVKYYLPLEAQSDANQTLATVR